MAVIISTKCYMFITAFIIFSHFQGHGIANEQRRKIASFFILNASRPSVCSVSCDIKNADCNACNAVVEFVQESVYAFLCRHAEIVLNKITHMRDSFPNWLLIYTVTYFQHTVLLSTT